ncbi:NUDIX hydrolase [Dinoroseobacter shibae DFL 12 = DSM 16493]|jgi:NAD+ diphosphatase|uniref:NAD(+) diphosphatase n=1 Tax=Dinoroseobacter shibae (strain DSM 16493 / NCIMB 14021 / DFL 12) TaxID=398580 RepID=A8LQB1_DINSH|nr:NAD(+) diphosphatase [Dinoroseobacter shibae]ABV92397.1 NUDIX hydrolase [Dinoroseobacter shibae DFL 12 = DSM 16493]URF47343.1 NAD(+) diphosphatase [Dinoroseobacter shibae]URF51654.1 NAD(+) diphosphatase [Dinoroseobacter shibae]
MPFEDSITFGSSGLERAAHLRMDPEAMARLVADPAARAIAFWRAKPAVSPEGLVKLPLDHPVLEAATEAPIFLGLDKAGPRFAYDLSGWQPVEEVGELDSFLDRSEQQHPDLPEGHLFKELRGVMTLLTRREAELAAAARQLLEWHRTHGFCSMCGVKSDQADAGWQRLCPSCGRRHFPRTDPVVIMLITRGNKVLVGRSPGWPERMYSLLAGFVEPGETLEGAVRREVYEEAGVRVGPVRYIASQPWPYPASLMMGCAGEAVSDAITVDPVEIEDARWMGREEMIDVFAGTHPEMREPRKGAIAHSLLSAWLRDEAR